ncbi:protein phosphatase 2C domain-containing protein [uncultured Gemmiger sp.]|uniref:PP2C family protein-serine/threonine phosphatase n=1 Tax=uncultured Gemmiger sp. TaxID=1623490 RepID=UPI0025EAED52|nr:protein phosphatase 2C domain-containing protein [uncultured Gemmiger sp.]
MKYQVAYSCISDVGLLRSDNQDNFVCNGRYLDGRPIRLPMSGTLQPEAPVAVGVFDGLGGEDCGAVASRLAAAAAAGYAFGHDPVKGVARYCRDANAEICSWVGPLGISAMGTTVAMLVFAPREIVLCNIGDSKIFRFDGSTLQQISRDHLAVAAYGVKPPLSQNLGIPPTELEIEPYIAHGAYRAGDLYLICSDGLTDMVSTQDIARILAGQSFETAAQTLLRQALDNGGRDNVTILLCQVRRAPGWLAGLCRHNKV